MNILFDIGHPAHFHLFKNFIRYLKKSAEHEITITTRDKDITNSLLDYYQLDYLSLSKPGQGKSGLFKELFIRDYQIFKLHSQKKFDLAFGTSVSIGHLSQWSKVKSINFNEDDDDVVPLYSYLSYPFCTVIVNPTCVRFKRWKAKRIFVNSYHELAYLHPNNFQPDARVIQKYNLKKDKYIVIRFSALKAHHDVGAKGISEKILNRIRSLPKEFEIIESIEGAKNFQIAPWDMHHVLAFARLVISDSQTMTAEAAVLGVPALRCNSFVGKLSYLEELEHKYGLTFGFKPEDEDSILKKTTELLEIADSVSEYQGRREKMLKEKIDLNAWMINYFQQLSDN